MLKPEKEKWPGNVELASKYRAHAMMLPPPCLRVVMMCCLYSFRLSIFAHKTLLNRWCETLRWHFANFKISAMLFFVCLFLFFILSGCFLSLSFHNHHSFSVLKIYFRKLQRFLQVFQFDSLVLLLSLNTFKVLSKLSVDTYQSFLKRADSNLPFL